MTPENQGRIQGVQQFVAISIVVVMLLAYFMKCVFL